MPIDPYAALNAMLRAEVTRSTPTAPKPPARGTDGEGSPTASVAGVATPATGSESSPEA
ncbi:hypothetical protein ACIQU4_23055 [Streptomyces sp. NPDC090741]|uniref:hypothetical protein n=1 Tax=Streptomyces sp. NPDC090741 TaxID=3365967 RepID=UPI0037FD8555